MPLVRTLLLFLSLPAGVVGYSVGFWVVSSLASPGSPNELVALFVPLLAGGLVMMPFLMPFFEHKARQDLAARPTQEPPTRRTGGGKGKRR